VTVALHPSPATFRAQAGAARVVPVWREVLADQDTPLSVFRKLVGDGPGFLLESVEHGDRWGRFSFVGRPQATFVVRGGRVEAEGAVPDGAAEAGGVLALLRLLAARHRSPARPGLPPFHGGVVGYLGYDVVREVERLPHRPPDPLGWPDALLMLTGQVAAFDHFGQRLYLIENVVVPAGEDPGALNAAYDAAAERLAASLDALARPLPPEPLPEPADAAIEPAPATPTMSSPRYRAAVEAAREHILAGDIFQVVLAKRFDLTDRYDPLSVYRVLRQVNPSPYMYYLHHPEATLVGSSPEPMVQVRDGRVISRPIAGTRFRGRDDAHDRRLAAELAEHPKERAEHVMLVDLARNDLGRVVRFGTERVDELMALERYSHVMHLVSQVSGELAPGADPVDVLAATFPAGTVSGAPKVRAMEIIDELEPVGRGPYAGVVGYLDFSGNLDTAITIRTMCWRDGRASVQAGAGIVADSDPADEDLECANKARALLVAAAASRRLRAGSPDPGPADAPRGVGEAG
jgi:anthranilate synthase component 1